MRRTFEMLDFLPKSYREKRFRAFFSKTGFRVARVSLIIAIGQFAIAGLIDFFLAPEIFHATSSIRFAVIIPVLLFSLGVSFSHIFMRRYPFILSACILVTFFGLVKIIHLSEFLSHAYILHFFGILLDMVWIFTLSKLIMAHAWILGLGIILAFNIFLFFDSRIPDHPNQTGAWIILNFFLGGFFIINALVLFFHERLMRENFRLRRKNIATADSYRKSFSNILNIHAQIQRSLLPENLCNDRFEIAVYYVPAEDISGDYMDVIRGASVTWVAIGDVAGKGFSAGLIMLMTQVAIRTAICTRPDNFKDSAEILAHANDVISTNIARMNRLNRFVTVSLLALEADGRFYYSGLHQPIVILRNSSLQFEKLESRGSWLGMPEVGNKFFLDRGALDDGDIAFLYTDGISEAQKAGKIIRLDEVTEVIRTYRNNSLEAIKERLVEKLNDLDTSDDVSFILIRKVA